MKWFLMILFLALTGIIFWALEFPHGPIPPPGKFLNPFAGFWQNNTKMDQLPEKLVLPGLTKPVTVLFDKRMVPHIFAENDHDLYFAQGFVTAKYRLWQMEFQTYAAAGRLSEILGANFLPYDQFMRRIGLTYAAEKSLQTLETETNLKVSVDAYVDGINAFIKSMRIKDYPIEYKILDYKPEPWTSEKCMLLLKYMAWDLTGYFSEKSMTAAAQVLDKNQMNLLYPFQSPFAEPIVPIGTKWSFKAKVPTLPKNLSRLPFSNEDQDVRDQPEKGSNNWAVSGAKTKSGFPILCNDPHLRLSLPSLWYEIQLISPTVNAYGVSLPGAPYVIIGFNKEIAWGVTNATSDVLDWYSITFKDSTCREYYFQDHYLKTTQRIEEIRVRNAKTVLDAVFYSHHGPIVYRKNEKPFHSNVPVAAAMRWKAHDASNEAFTFYLLNRATDYPSFVQALTYYECPAQNFAFASVAGDIAIWHNGKFPLRWKGQGRFIMDGSRAENEWQGWVPHEHNPHIQNPRQGFVSSANQNPTDGDYPYYLGWDYASFERSARINQLLREMKDIHPEDMVEMQLDNQSLFAKKILPILFANIDADVCSAKEKQALQLLREWDCNYRSDAIAPTIFSYWRVTLYDAIFDDDLKSSAGRLQPPSREVMLYLILNNPDNPFLDDIKATEHESLSNLVYPSFRKALDELTVEHGEMSDQWRWGHARSTDILHIAQIPGFGRTKLQTNGNYDVINAITENGGPSWRMVIELGPHMKGQGIYPGGQSGNPGSNYYDNMVDDWVAGKCHSFIFLQSVDDKNVDLIGKTELRGDR